MKFTPGKIACQEQHIRACENCINSFIVEVAVPWFDEKIKIARLNCGVEAMNLWTGDTCTAETAIGCNSYHSKGQQLINIKIKIE